MGTSNSTSTIFTLIMCCTKDDVIWRDNDVIKSEISAILHLKGLGHAILGNFREFQHGSNSHRIN